MVKTTTAHKRYTIGKLLPQPGGALKGKWPKSGDWKISSAFP
jgi:hypothetical protein